MRTGISRKSTRLLAGLVLAAVGLVPGTANAQRLGVIGIGAFGRLGSVPPAFDPGVPVAVEATVQWPIVGRLHLATSADLTIQRIATQTSLSSADLSVEHIVRRPYSFDVAHFGIGPGFAVQPSRKLLVSGSLQAIGLVPSWNSASVGTCGGNCAILGPSAKDQQTEFHMGMAGRLRFTFGSHKERLGFEVLGIVGPRHSGSQIPLTTLAFMLVVGAS